MKEKVLEVCAVAENAKSSIIAVQLRHATQRFKNSLIEKQPAIARIHSQTEIAIPRESVNRILVNFFVQRSELRDLYDKVAAGERISEADALRLFESKDLNAIGAIADLARLKKVGNRASYIINRYVNYSNYCILSCQFCSFARKRRDADGFELTTAQIVEKAREALKLGITELHIVGGLHPSLPFSYYVDMLKALKAVDPKLQLKCFTAIEILHLAWLAKKSVEETLRELKAAGLDSLTGGGAEIFRKEVRSSIARGKESAEEYLDVHRTWHKMGGRSTCTMLFGHVERWRTASITCTNCACCRMKRTASSVLFRCPTNRKTTISRSKRRPPALIHCAPWRSAASFSITSITSRPIG